MGDSERDRQEAKFQKMGEIKVTIDFIHLPHSFYPSLKIETKCRQGIISIFNCVLHMLFVERCSYPTTKSGENQFVECMMQCIVYNTVVSVL